MELIDKVAKSVNPEEINEFFYLESKKASLEINRRDKPFLNVIQKSLENNNLMPLKMLLNSYLEVNNYRLKKFQEMVAKETIAQEKLDLINKLLLGQLTSIELLALSTVQQDKKNLFNFLVFHQDIKISPSSLLSLNAEVYKLGQLDWIKYCEEKTEHQNKIYPPHVVSSMLSSAFSFQSIEILQYLEKKHNVNLSSLKDFYQALSTASQNTYFFNHPPIEQVNFINYLLNAGANPREIIKGFFTINFNEINQRQEIFNEVVSFINEKTFYSDVGIIYDLKGLRNIESLEKNYFIWKEAKILEKTLETKNLTHTKFKL